MTISDALEIATFASAEPEHALAVALATLGHGLTCLSGNERRRRLDAMGWIESELRTREGR